MRITLSKIWIIIFVLASVFSTNLAYAQHHGGQAAPPVSFGDRQVTVSTSIDPVNFTPGKDNIADLKVRFFDSQTNLNIEKVTYRVQIFYGDALVASQMFYDKDGELDVKIQPNSECMEKEIWRCTKYEGEKDPVVPSALTSSTMSTPIIKGPVFDKPGAYKVKIAIIGATNPKTQTTEDIEFENTIHIAQEQQFSLTTTQGKTPVIVRAFQDEISNFEFFESTKIISFEMPFHWEHTEHVSLIRNDIEIPKSFAPLQNINNFKGTINGAPVFVKDIYFDPFTNKDVNIIHFLVTGEELKTLESKIGENKHTMIVQIVPDTSNPTKISDIKFTNDYKATVMYDPRYGESKDVVFTVAFFDSSGALAKDLRYAYSVKDSKGNEFIVNTGSDTNRLGIPLSSGVDSRLITIPDKGKYTLQLVLIGKGLIDFDPFVPASLPFDIDTKIITPEPSKVSDLTVIPAWVKNNAKFWSQDQITDKDFVSGIQFLIKQGIIKIPSTTQGESTSKQIPPWVKNNAKWWSEGTIEDKDFINGIQFLVSQGLIRV